MFQFLPMIASLLQGQQQKQEQQKHDNMAAMLGQAPSAGGAQASAPGAGIMGMAGQMLGGRSSAGAAKDNESLGEATNGISWNDKPVYGHSEPDKEPDKDSDDMLQGMYGDKENAPDDEDLLNMKV